jgi:hypothetical protein
MFAPNDRSLQSKTDALIDQLSGAWLVLTGQLTEQKKGKRTVFQLEPKDPPKDPKPRNPKDASRPRPGAVDYNKVPSRKVLGPMNVYYYDYVADRASVDDLRTVEKLGSQPRGEIILYETLNLVDGKRSIQAIRNYIAAAYGQIAVEDVSDYFRILEKIGVIKLD